LLLIGCASKDDTVIAGGMGESIAVSSDAAETWSPVDKFKFIITQDVKHEKTSDTWLACGSFNSFGGVAYTQDPANGPWSLAKIPDGTFLDGRSIPRYCSIPSASVMYATAGTWDMSDDNVEDGVRVTKNVAMGNDGQLKLLPRRNMKDKKKGAKKVDDDGDVPVAWGQVAKSTDGGETWSIVYEDATSGMYPNDIHCYDEDSCIFVMDGSGTENESQIVSTKDGGRTWDTFTVPTGAGNSLMVARMTGPYEAWAAGGDSTGRIWHTTDLVNWDDSEFASKDAVFVTGIAIDESNKSGYVTGILRSQVSTLVKFEY
jgi:hypothetical protein